MKKIRKILIVFLLLLGTFLATIGLIVKNYTSKVSNNSEEIEIKIESGTVSSIATLLKENNLIKNKDFFKLYCKLTGKQNLKAGTYKLSESMNLHEIVDELLNGSKYNPNEITIKFPEGSNMRDIATIISNKTNNTYEEVMKINEDTEYLEYLINKYFFIEKDILNKDIYYALEGYLFPDTYRFTNKNVSVKEIFNKLLDQMEKVLNEYKDEIETKKYSIHEILTIASITELESGVNADRYKIASVFYNRYNKKMSLGSDITTRYALKVPNDKVLTKTEYNTVNKYNTRSQTTAGKLPPSPICMVSLSSIKAAINPDSGNNIFFISNIKTGETFFYEKENEFLKKKKELEKVNGGY